MCRAVARDLTMEV